jgi:hypothetical protein
MVLTDGECSVQADGASAQLCSGNPHSCGSMTFYDLLECNSQGVWMTVASNGCPSNGGSGLKDAGTTD